MHFSTHNSLSDKLYKVKKNRLLKDKIKIFVPTKFFWQITSKIDLLQEVRTRVRSQEFNAFLASNFEEFTFAEPIYKKNKYIIVGIRY